MNFGWIKLPRSLLHDPIIKKPELFQLFVYCLLRANHSDNDLILNGEMITVKRGSFVTGRKVLADELMIKEATIRDRLKKLEKFGYISRYSTTKFTIINVHNYCISGDEIFNFHQQTTNKMPALHQQSDTNKNDKNVENEKNIYDFWNFQNITVHREFTDKMSSLISEKLKNYSIGEIKNSIANYKKVLNDDKYYFTHKWTLTEFLSSQKFDTFLDINNPLKNYLTNKESQPISNGGCYQKYIPEQVRRGHYLDTRESSLQFVLDNLNNRYAVDKVNKAREKWDITDEELGIN